MNLAAIDWLSISINLLLVVFVIVCLLMILLILMQRPKQEGLGAAFGAGVTDQVFGARTTNVLQRGTVYLGSMFFILALTLAILIGHKNKTVQMEPVQQPEAEVEQPKATEPAKEPGPKSLSEELPVAPPTPTTPPVTPPKETPATPAPETPAPAPPAPATPTPATPAPATPAPATPAPATPAPATPAPATPAPATPTPATPAPATPAPAN